METDACHSMMMRTLEMVTAKDNYYGFNDNGKLEGINAGLTEIIAKIDNWSNEMKKLLTNKYGDVVEVQ